MNELFDVLNISNLWDGLKRLKDNELSAHFKVGQVYIMLMNINYLTVRSKFAVFLFFITGYKG